MMRCLPRCDLVPISSILTDLDTAVHAWQDKIAPGDMVGRACMDKCLVRISQLTNFVSRWIHAMHCDTSKYEN